MGNSTSSSNYVGGQAVLGSGTPRGTLPSQAAADPRSAAAEAAERRMKSSQQRGTNESNPNRGKLTAQLVEQNSAKDHQELQMPERVIVSMTWLSLTFYSLPTNAHS
ncbi:hypothetical protein CPB83DRAFT_863970 [Crepidotus variabilis]|uniref:Uncharacterized protein n=1 Tax=Crepidotus variabilis TaxID=179855 RepID=A0A9P6E587_9AGAR|nr:hypothetical protein CPB83DRAFT_863970 [Crepidotus variabilis]